MSEFDYVIVGGGAAGCILAGRLSERGLKVLLLEAGLRRRSPLLSVPAAETVFVNNPRYDWRFETEPDPTLNHRRLSIPRGRLLGGSNAINGLLFVRGQSQDYDGWQKAGAEGWNWASVLPYFCKLEDWAGTPNAARGQGGPIRIEFPRQREALCDVFLEAAQQVGYNLNADYNCGMLEGFGYYQCTSRRGRRVSVVDGYLREARPNLAICANARVTRLNLKGDRCVGVFYAVGSTMREASVRNDVILAAGTIGSPHILELSGIGNPSALKGAGIAVQHELPGVGENFRDHFAVRLRWRVQQRVTFNERTKGLSLLQELGRYLFNQSGALSMPIAIGFGFVRSKTDEPNVDLQFHFAPASYGAGPRRRLEEEPGMTIGVYPLRPESTGAVHVRSVDPNVPPAIHTRFLSHEVDRLRLIAGMKIARHIVAAPAFERYRGTETTPGASFADEDALLAHARAAGDTSYHPVGTCRMGNDVNAVVDSRLRVRGLTGLRVVDASVMPTMVSGNTQAATMMIAEKGSAMVCEDRQS